MKRQSNFELLRIFAMLGVVFLHYYNDSIGQASALVEKNSINFFILNFFESTFICAVNVFVLICGYFLSQTYKRNLIKPIQLIVEVSAIKSIVYLLNSILNKNFSIYNFLSSLLPSNWFVILYIVLFVISPYINIVINKLNHSQLRKLVILFLSIFSIFPTFFDLLSDIFDTTIQLSPIGMYGNQSGYTIVNFVLMYLIGAYLAKSTINKIKLRNILCLLLINIAVLFIFMYKYKNIALSYCNPFVISEAVLFLCFFAKIHIKENTFINAIAKEAFSVFLLHFYFYQFINIEFFVNRNPILLVLHIIFSSCAIYLACWVIGFIYTKITTPIFTFISNKCPFLIWNIEIDVNTPKSR